MGKRKEAAALHLVAMESSHAELLRIVAHCEAFNVDLNDKAIAPNGDDFNRLCGIIGGQDFDAADIEEGGR